MSGFGLPGGGHSYDDQSGAELERQLQEEFRRRHTMPQAAGGPQGSATFVSLGRPSNSRSDYGTHLNMLGPEAVSGSPYGNYARQSMPQGQYGRSNAPYMGDMSSVSQMYGVQHHNQQAMQSAAAANYAVGYGGAPGLDHHAAAVAAHSAAAHHQHYGGASANYAAMPPSGGPSPVPYPSAGGNVSPVAAMSVDPPAPPLTGMDPQTAQEIAIMKEAFNRERKKSMSRQMGGYVTSKTTSSANATANSANSNSSSSVVEKPVFSSRALRLPPPTKTNSGAKKDSAVLSKDKEGKAIVEDRGSTWYMGCVPLGVDDDKYWLSELQVFLRANFAEAFAATEDDIAAPMHGRNKPIALGQVGIRCMHCKNDNPAERGQQATSYPSLISGIYNSVQQMLRLHLDCCLTMPKETRNKIEHLKASCSSRGGRKQYWVDSAKRLGLVDTPHGIHFIRDPSGPLPPLTGPSVNSKENRKKKLVPPKPKKPKPPKPAPEEEMAAVESNDKLPPPPPVDTRPLVFPEDKALISDYLYLTLEQMAPCYLMEADRVGCYKTRKVGFPGLACKHCVGQAGCGRYFPASEASLSQTTTSQTIMNHVRNCRRCPVEIRENLEIMKRNRMGPDGKRSEKPKHGGRKVFFHRLWCRIQGVPLEEGKGKTKESKRRKAKKAGKKKKSGSPKEDHDETDDEEDDDDEEAEEDGTGTDTDETGSEEGSEEETDYPDSKPKEKRKSESPDGKKGATQWHEGCVRLTKIDDPHWLPEIEVFARGDLVEVFSYSANDELEGYGGRKEPAEGQVGVRCIFCKGLDATERPSGSVCFPDSLSSIHTKVSDMIRLHFPSCPAMPDDARETFKSLRGFGAKVATDDSQQYWVDSARDIGLANVPPAGPRAAGAWGISFRRDPLEPSPADELDLENQSDHPAADDMNSLIRSEDKGLCTDQVLLLMRQVGPCRFKKSDRRAGPGSRGRDRAMGFPGLSCLHCTGRNTLGRYFPMSAKNLTDSTVNSLQSHVASCSRCPEQVKASLAYLAHRSILQKAELSGSWKKSYFQKVWSRLHTERDWTADDDDDEGEGNEAEGTSVEDDEHHDIDMVHDEEDESTPSVAAAASRDEGGDRSDGEREETGNQMSALIQAAAIWLTEQDNVTDTKGSGRAVRGRSLPAKRPGSTTPAEASEAASGTSPTTRGRGASNLPTKRRRVHF